MIPKAPALLPLTTTILRTIAAANGIGAGQTGLAQSRTIGLAFENWVLTSMGQIPRNTTSFLSPARQNANNGGLPKSVIPEFVAGLGLWWSDYGLVGFPESMFFEVKAVTGVMTQSTSRYQLVGLVDVAAMSPAGSSTMPSHPPPAVVFTTTANTGIGADVLTYATQRGVAIWQEIVEYDAASANPQNPDLYIELALPLNLSVYGTASVAPMPPLWPHSPLTSPKTPAINLIVPGDPALVAYVGEVMRGVSGGRWTTNGNEPIVQARDGRVLQPFVLVVLPMLEPSRRVPLRAAVDIMLRPYKPEAGPPGTLLNPVERPMPPRVVPDPSGVN